MKIFGIIFGIFIILSILGVAGFFVWKSWTKDQLIEKIMYKFGNQASPDYNPDFDAQPSGLKKFTIAELKGILSGALK